MSDRSLVAQRHGGGCVRGHDDHGVRVVLTNRDLVRSVRVGVELVSAIVKLYPDRLDLAPAAGLFGSSTALARIQAGDDPAVVARSWNTAESKWRELRAKYLIYR